MEIKFEAVTNENCNLYCKLGIKAYKEHYLHLWKNNDPSPYIEKSFIQDIVKCDLKDTTTLLLIIYAEKKAVGILKLIKDIPFPTHTSKDAIFLEKIYLLNEFSGKGIGSIVLKWVETYGLDSGKKMVWLETMQKGPALNFYLKNGYQIMKEKQLEFEQVLEEQKPMYVLLKRPYNS
jgi:GNAT superfamily N-acetyltransferase